MSVITLQTCSSHPARLWQFARTIRTHPTIAIAIKSLEIHNGTMRVQFIKAPSTVKSIDAFVRLLEKTDVHLLRMLNLEDLFTTDPYCAGACHPDVETRVMERVQHLMKDY